MSLKKSTRSKTDQKKAGIAHIRLVWKSKRPVFIFVGGFTLLMVIFYAIWLSNWFNNHINPIITSVNATLSSVLLNLLGQDTSSSGASIYSTYFSLSVAKGCDGVEAMAVFASALLSFPMTWRKKIPGIFLGVSVLFLLNIIRIVSLFLVGVYRPSLSDIMHTEVWQVVFILAAVALWAGWIYRSKKIRTNEIKANDT
jgi:exosortase H (IPTLxxWG-CTERM-specific)